MLQPRFVRHHAKHLVVLALVAIVGLLVLSGLPAAASNPASAPRHTLNTATSDIQPDLVTNNYRQTNLVSDIPGFAQIQDPLLINPWGVAFSATSPFWTANNGTSTATLYGGDVGGSPFAKNPLNVTIPGTPAGLPTGVVFSGSATDFSFTGGGSTGPARFIFSSISGNITAWKGGLTTAVVVASKP
ncbi:MAG TPA: TIGR03118 family protein, partial [Pyrinomonadaceae bacterium]|nr:TIGR03118 family protein [Pyrinomonadaceae bacterium]